LRLINHPRRGCGAVRQCTRPRRCVEYPNLVVHRGVMYPNLVIYPASVQPEYRAV